MSDIPSSHHQTVAAYVGQAQAVISAITSLAAPIGQAADLWIESLRTGGKILFCGNGGSAADAQHLAAELLGRFLTDREPMPALSLTVDTSSLTAISNDFGYETVFSRQLKGIGRQGDVLVGLSTSGNSRNVVNAFALARTMGVRTVGLTGQHGGAMAELSDILIAVPDARTNHIQEAHITIGHLICAIVETTLYPNNA
ncbi:SIS domain-containing protein [Gluconacetobacter sacchari]|uniref:D-sedoheptulose-7-phosphate isomerase n=1 Tax=Gluconacetobacter sacchari TaxID=92759 RepID=UPI0039B4F8EC